METDPTQRIAPMIVAMKNNFDTFSAGGSSGDPMISVPSWVLPVQQEPQERAWPRSQAQEAS